ncbi:uncharacterized protein J4E78_000222 [Alternaria triticimaculans]|uniref:uncharacterized protein n=1 Tax=Alternaria triticimaculans TaxID=297637 RepID=UPI0020C2721F|nr:uncharacterized protein J4E78_000222 [Alternaria triticimaculans]KAI4671726.1 hypothetical protein J4E78_000222 [Alternaria triticimaculans]
MSSFVQAYKIDQSCDAKGVTVDVRNAMTSAFEMVSAAYETLTQPPLSSDAQDLVGFLFAREGANPAQLLQQGKLEKTITLLRNIRTYMSTEVTGDATVSASDVIIFCHYDRWVQLEGHKDLWEDTTNGYKLKFNEQQCRGSILDNVALAVSANPPAKQIEQEIANTGVFKTTTVRRPAQIQLCSWFVDWIKQKEYKTADDVQKRTKIGRKMINRAASNRMTFGLGLNQIDAYSLLDKVLLHEMTHARGAFQEWTKKGVVEGIKDVLTPNIFLRQFDWAAYGWEGVGKLARKGGELNTPGGPDNNADTIALFGSACKLMRDPQNPRKVDSKGRIVPVT